MAVNWFEMGQEGIKLRIVKVEGKKESHLLLLGLTIGSEEWEACQLAPLNFRRSPTGKNVLIRVFSPSNPPMLSHFRAVFPNARKVVVQNASEIRLQLEGGAKLSPQEIALAAAMRVAVPVGMSLSGQRVFERADGTRFVVDAEGNRLDEDTLPAALSLRADDANLANCVRGFIVGLVSGAHADVADIGRFVDVLYGQGASADFEKVTRVAQVIEAEMSSRVLERHGVAGDSAYREAQLLYENSPPHVGIQKGPGAVPLPLAVAVQELVRAFGGEGQVPIYIPQLYDGALATMLGPAYVTLTDPAEPESADARLRPLVPRAVNVVERSLNESVPPHRVSTLSAEDVKPETLASLRSSMLRRHPNGLTTLLFPEFVSDEEAGRAAEKERVNAFIMSIQSEFEVLGLGQLSSVMRRKMHIQPGLMVMAVGRKYSERERELRGDDWMPRKLDTMFDWDAVRTFTNDVLVRVHEAAGNKLSAEEEAALRANEGAENSYQLPYESFSKNGDVQLMIPRNLAGPTYRALQNLQDRAGDLDEYVRNAVGFTEEQYAYLAPEQVDAVALMVSALDRNKGFVLGDQTGAGKGVTLASAVGYAWQRGLPVIFVTKQDNLFSDFYRDLKQTGLHTQMRPMVLNHGASVIDQFSDDLTKVASGISRKKFMENYQFGLEGMGNPNIVFCTYSQFNKGEDAEKSEWIKTVAKGAIVLFDEAHMAAGDTSQLGVVCTDVANAAKGVIYSSATWLKDARQMGFYARMLPQSIDTSMVAEAMQAGGESIQEVFTAMLAQDGLFIRRERDASELQIDMALDTGRVRENEQISDQVALILQGLQRLCGVTDQVGRRLTRAQIAKLDRAQAFIQGAVDRAYASSKRAIAEMRARAGVDDDTDEDEEDGGNVAEMAEAARQAAALLANNHAQQVIADEAAMVDNAEAEEGDFLAAERARQVIDAGTMAVEEAEAILNGEVPVAASLMDLRLEDLGLAPAIESNLSSALGALGGAEGEGAMRQLQSELRKIKKMMEGVKTQTTSFGSLLFSTQRTLNVALQARYAGERAVAKLREGKKPIIFLEQTFEQRLKEALEDPGTVRNDDGTYRIAPQTLKGTLRTMYETVVRMTHIDAEGNRIDGTVLESGFMANEEERAAVTEGLATLDDMIEQLPDDLYCSPIDTICHAITRAGFTVGEATGRKFKVVDMQHDHWTVAPRPAKEMKLTNIERAFNFGGYDAVVGNKAVSTGVSLHASAQFDDQRQRSMLFCQVFGDIVDYVQAIGRADRRGQVIAPECEMLASGLQSEARIMMVHYAHLRKLYASATSNRSSRFELHELPDLFNSVGDASVRDFLQANPAIATRLGIEFRQYMPTAVQPNGVEINAPMHGLAKRTVARLDLLPDKESRNVYQEITFNFNEVVAELNEQGVNPLKTNILEPTAYGAAAAITGAEDLLPAKLNDHGEVDSVFDEAVELQTVTMTRRIRARSWEDSLAEVEANTQAMFHQSRRDRAANETPDFVPDLTVPAIYRAAGGSVEGPLTGAVRMLPSGLRERVTKMFDGMLLMMRSSEAARLSADQTINPGKTTDDAGNELLTPNQTVIRRRDWLLSRLQYLMPGQHVIVRERSFGMGEEKVLKGMVVSLALPPRGRETNLSRWIVRVQMAGYREPTRYTLADLYRKSFVGTDEWLPSLDTISDGLFETTVPEYFNNYDEHNYVRKGYVLCGNLFRAAAIAAKHKIGAGAVLQMPAEAPRRVINIRRHMTKEQIYSTVPVELSSEGVASLFCTTWGGLDRPPAKNASYWADFLRCSLDRRGMHSDSESKNANVSIYWMPTRSNFIDDVTEEITDEEREERRMARQNPDEEAAAHMLSGIGARVRKTCLDREEQSALASAINSELGFEAVSVMRGSKVGATVRLVMRFKDAEGKRASDDAIRNQIAVFVRHVTSATETNRFFSTSPAMRLLAMAVTERTREQSRQLREAGDEARLMRVQMKRLVLADQDGAGETESDDEPGTEQASEDQVEQERAA